MVEGTLPRISRRLRRRRAAKATVPQRPAHLGFQIHAYWVKGILLGLSLLLMSLMYAPLDQWYLGFVCMVPWLIVIGGTAMARRVYVSAWLLGFVFFLINMWWMEAPTGMGYVALSAYLACYFPAAACPLRHAVRRRRVPLAIAFPIVWVGAEYLRSLVISGFPWFFLAHSQYKMLAMIQISDLFGAYGVTFVLGSVNGAIADAIFARWGEADLTTRQGQRRRARLGLALAVTLVVATLVYGVYALGLDTSRPGPRVALLQQNYPSYSDPVRSRAQPGPRAKAAAYLEMMREASAQRPDLILFPETAWTSMHLNQEFLSISRETLERYYSGYYVWAQRLSRQWYEYLQKWSTDQECSIVIGSASVTPTPLSLRSTEVLHNSAFHFRPDGSTPERHDKIHPVVFGETVPFRYGRLRFLYLWLNRLSPFGSDDFEYSLTAGDDVRVFTMETRQGETYRFGVPICYEDVMPYVCRRFVWDPETKTKRVDFLANISNDGWFLYRNELPQHFAICTFRAVENRVGIARTVNTGISGFIDANGRSHDKIEVGETGFRVASVMTDSRVSLYTRIGDVFALSCALVWLLFCIDYVAVRALAGGRAEDGVAR